MLSQYGIIKPKILRNPAPALLYEHALKYDEGSTITDTGALVSFSGEKTGRCPDDKRIVKNKESEGDIDWGAVNIALSEESFSALRQSAWDFLDTKDHLYVIDAFAGWDKKNTIKVRVICTRPYHALFMHNMLIRPSAQELENYGEPDYVIFNAGGLAANVEIPGITSSTSVSLSFEHRQMVILGTDYAGEMKKGVFTIMNYLMPKRGHVSLHCSVNEGADGDVSVFLGLSGTGKTTLSADARRKLVGDDEHYWTENGLFNIEGGCYAKCDHLSAEREPEIYNAIRFGSLLENVVLREDHSVDYDNVSITPNTRASYPIEFIANAKVPCQASHANRIVFLTADAYGIFPPVSRLTIEQAMYFFINGFTSKIAGTEVGIKEPKPTFSACYGAPFMVWHPKRYAEILAERIKQHNCSVWLVNTGWTGGKYGTGVRIPLGYTRKIIDAINSGSLEKADFENISVFDLSIPKHIEGVPDRLLNPREAWEDKKQFDTTYQWLQEKFTENNAKFL